MFSSTLARRAHPLFTVILSMTLLTSCGHASAPEIQPVSDSPKSIWQASSVPAPVGIVRLVPGGSVELTADRAVMESIHSIESATYDEERLALQVEVNGTSLKLTASDKSSAGWGFVRVRVRTEGGASRALDLPVIVEPHPAVTFAFTPEAGREPRQVFVAGEFNGWAGSRDRLDRQADGSFAARLAIAPGTYSYKFVVDGDWIRDPANPRVDASGYGNSLLTVPGQRAESLRFVALSDWMPGSGPQGAMALIAPAGAVLDPAGVAVAVNNRLMPASHYTVDTQRGIVRLNLPPDEWHSENHVVVLACDTQGRTGEFEAAFDTADAPRSPRDEVIYFAMTDRFHNGNPAIDDPADHPELHPLANYHGGDWQGIRRKIEEGYFDRLGVTTLWLSPPNENTPKVERDAIPPHRLFTSYHGYWPTSLTNTNPQFGTMEDLRALVREAHGRGIAVLLDFVANHVHEDHPLLAERPEWVVPRETPDGRKNIRLFDEFPLTTWFDDFLPTLDYDANDELIDIMADNAIYWLEQSGADGFRHDAVKHLPEPFWRALTARLREYSRARGGRGFYQVGETISDRETITRFVGPDMMDGQFDFPLLWRIQEVLARGEGTMGDLGEALLDSYTHYPAHAIMSPLLGNHDTPRFMGIADGDFPVEGLHEKEIGFVRPPVVDDPASYEKLKLAFAFLMTIPGPPAIYYGDEMGLTGAHDPDNRRSLPWTRSEAEEAVTESVASLTAARHASSALRRGALHMLAAGDEHLVFIRTAPQETVLVALFRRPEGEIRLPIPAWWGQSIALRPLDARNMRIRAENGQIVLHGADWSHGAWKVVTQDQ